jgi:hypothetical protein
VNEHFRRAGNGPMRVVAGDTRGMIAPFVEAEPDWTILNKVRDILRPGQQLMELYSEIGIGASQIREWSKEKIRVFAEQARRNNAAEGIHSGELDSRWINA